jgi:regulatory protein YycI of two-component signal transduction system YycFG
MKKISRNIIIVVIIIIIILIGAYLLLRRINLESAPNEQQEISHQIENNKLSNETVPQNKSIEEELAEFSDNENKTLPDGEIYKVSSSGKELTIFLKMEDVPVINQEWADKVLKKILIENTTCVDPQMRGFLEKGASIIYNVSNISGSQNGKTTIVLLDCQ